MSTSAWIPALAPVGDVSIREDPTSVSAVGLATSPGMEDVLVRNLSSTPAPHGSAPCKPQKEQEHRQHPSPAVSQPVWPEHIIACVEGLL